MFGLFLIGSSEDLLNDGLYPLTIVKEISMEDLQRVKKDNIIIINIFHKEYFNPDQNEWKSLDRFDKFSDRWK